MSCYAASRSDTDTRRQATTTECALRQVMPASSASARKVPKHARHLSSRKTGLGLPRKPSGRFELFVARAEGETLREWLQRNQEASLVSRGLSLALALLSVYQALSHVFLNWSHVRFNYPLGVRGARVAAARGDGYLLF